MNRVRMVLWGVAAACILALGTQVYADPISLVVVTSTGKTLTFPVKEDQKVAELKELIANVAAIPPGNQRLYAGTVELMYDHRIGEYALADGDTIQCRLGTGGIVRRGNPLKKVLPWIGWIAGIAAFIYVSKRWIFVRPRDEFEDEAS